MTSIEWLRNQLVNNENIRWRGTNINVLIEQAKEMHKAEIIKANRDGVDMVVDKKPFIMGEQYYQETFNNKQ
jgi:hypothetical protein